jgi:hypothetical protein
MVCGAFQYVSFFDGFVLISPVFEVSCFIVTRIELSIVTFALPFYVPMYS